MEKIEIGKIVKPQGIKGDVKVILFADDNFNLSNICELYIDNALAKIEKVYKLSDGCYGVKFDIIDSRNTAESFRGKLLYAAKEEIMLEDGRYFMSDLIKKQVEFADGTIVGKIVDIQNFGSADVFYIKGDKNVLCSHLDGLIVRLSDKKIVFDKQIFERGAVYED